MTTQHKSRLEVLKKQNYGLLVWLILNLLCKKEQGWTKNNPLPSAIVCYFNIFRK